MMMIHEIRVDKRQAHTRGSNRSYLNASLGNTNGLLLHSLVNRGLIVLVHLVKLVDAADTVVGQHQSTGLDGELRQTMHTTR